MRRRGRRGNGDVLRACGLRVGIPVKNDVRPADRRRADLGRRHLPRRAHPHPHVSAVAATDRGRRASGGAKRAMPPSPAIRKVSPRRTRATGVQAARRVDVGSRASARLCRSIADCPASWLQCRSVPLFRNDHGCGAPSALRASPSARRRSRRRTTGGGGEAGRGRRAAGLQPSGLARGGGGVTRHLA